LATTVAVAALVAAPMAQLATPVAVAASTVHARSGTYTGKLHYTSSSGTAETGKITVKVRKHHIKRLRVLGAIEDSKHSTGMNCGSANSYDSKDPTEGVKATGTKIHSDGTFATTFTGKYDRFVLKGKFKTAHKLVGTVKETSKDPVKGRCSSGVLPFHATR
jgi:uncharacterized protein with FMN-binding domain